ATHSRRRVGDLLVGRLDVGGGQRRAVVELDVLTDLECIGQTVGRDLPFAGDVADDLRVAVRVDLEQGAVQRRHQLYGGEGILLVRVEARRIGADDGQEHAAVARAFRRADRMG